NPDKQGFKGRSVTIKSTNHISCVCYNTSDIIPSIIKSTILQTVIKSVECYVVKRTQIIHTMNLSVDLLGNFHSSSIEIEIFSCQFPDKAVKWRTKLHMDPALPSSNSH